MNIIKIPLMLGEEDKRVLPTCHQNVYQRLFTWVGSYFNRFYRWGVLQHFMELFRYFTEEVLATKPSTYSGPNTFEELLKQFNVPPKEKTQQEIIRNYQVFLTLAQLEIDMLRMSASLAFIGSQRWLENNGTKFCDFVPCIVRPEVVYCCYGKN